MKRRYYDKVNHRCSHCGMLCDLEAYKLHSTGECFMEEMNKMKRQDELKKGGRRELPSL